MRREIQQIVTVVQSVQASYDHDDDSAAGLNGAKWKDPHVVTVQPATYSYHAAAAFFHSPVLALYISISSVACVCTPLYAGLSRVEELLFRP